MPELTVRALGEMIHLPLYEQLRILAEQKHPRQVPAVFRVPFYGPALAAIRNYYRRSNDAGVIESAIAEIENSEYLPARIEHNVAVLQAFRRGRQLARVLAPRPASRYAVTIAGLGIRFAPDLFGLGPAAK